VKFSGGAQLPRLSRNLHHLAGWLICLPLAFVALTGALLGLSGQIERILEPRLFSVQASDRPLLSKAQVRIRLSAYGDSLVLKPHAGPFDTYLADFRSPTGERRQLWIDPYSGKVLADRPARKRLAKRLKRLHRLGYAPLASLLAFGSLLVFGSGLLQFGSRRQGRYYWHSYAMLAVAPFALWQALSGLLLGFGAADQLVQDLHNPPHPAPRLLLVIAMLTLIGGLGFMLIERLRAER